MADSRYAGEVGLQAVFGQIKAAIAEKQDKINGMGLSHNDYSNEEKQKNAQNVSDIVELNSDIDDIIEKMDGDAILYQFAPVVTVEDAVPGNVALRAKVEPQQDLHGYDKPWVGGAGKNMMKIDLSNDSQTAAGMNFSHTDDTFTLKGTASSTFKIFNFNKVPSIKTNLPYVLSVEIVGSMPKMQLSMYVGDSQGQSLGSMKVIANGAGKFESNAVTFTADVASSTFTIEGIQADGDYDCTIKVQLEQNTQATDWSPYENICPITQYDSCKITRTGKNLWNEEFRIGDFDSITGKEISGNYFCSKDFIGVIPNTNYYFYSGFTEARCYAYQYDKDKKYLGNSEYINFNPNTVFRTSSNTYYIKFLRGGSYSTVYRNDMSIIDANIERKYYKYDGNDYQIELNGNTYYGQLRIDTQGNVYFDVDRAIAEFDGSDSTGWERRATYGTSTRFDYTGLLVVPDTSAVSNNIANYLTSGIIGTNNLECFNFHAINKLLQIQLHTDRLATDNVTGLMTYLASNHLQVCYKIATPFTITLKNTPINLLKGQNTIYVDTGDVEVTVNNTMDAIGSMQEQVNELDSDLSSLLKTQTETITADANGYLTTSLSAYRNMIIAVKDMVINEGAGSRPRPFLFNTILFGGASTNKIGLQFKEWDGTVIGANKEFTVTYVYIEFDAT